MYHWTIHRKDPKTAALKPLVNNANITSIEARDPGTTGARVAIKGYRVMSDGTRRDYQVILNADVIERAARELGLIK